MVPAENAGRELRFDTPHETDPLQSGLIQIPSVPDAMLRGESPREVVKCPPETAPGRSPEPTAAALIAGARRLSAVMRARELRAHGLHWDDLSLQLQVAKTTLWRWMNSVRHIQQPCAQDLCPGWHRSGRAPKIELTLEEARAIQAALLESNRTSTSGSFPEAVRVAAKRGLLRPAVADLVLARQAEGKPVLTERLRRHLALPEPTVRSLRAPRDAWLDYINSPGSLQLTRDELTREERFVRPGEWWTIDDATINFVCIVPGLERPGDKCWERFGVCIGRFQFLLVADHRSYYLPGFSYTARPRSSYRAEDITATLHNTFLEHGRPRAMVLEKGISAAHLIHRALDLAGVAVQHVDSPHQKVVEFIFNKLWTKLSLLPGQVGRFRGEEEELNRLYERCRAGAEDPRRHFLDIAAVVRALREVIVEHNASWIHSSRYGRWVPQEFWQREAPAILRPIAPQDDWMFAPHITKPLTVQGSCVETSVPMLPGISVKFAFSARWLLDWHRARVHLHFNPFASDCQAVAVLAARHRDAPAGAILGRLEQIDRLARFTRRALGYGADPDIGARAVQQNAQALRRSAQAILPDGRQGVACTEVRDGLGNAVRIQTDTAVPGIGPAPDRVSIDTARLDRSRLQLPEPAEPRWSSAIEEALI